MLSYLGYATILGLSAGASPGPLLTVVIAQTLRHNTREGIKVATAPLLTDLPIIGLALLLLSSLPEPDFILGLISFVGAAFVFLLGVGNVRQRPVELEISVAPPRSYLKGAAVNALSPHPYLFWFSVGVPTIVRAGDHSASCPSVSLASVAPSNEPQHEKQSKKGITKPHA